jgi:hypothetical protein
LLCSSSSISIRILFDHGRRYHTCQDRETKQNAIRYSQALDGRRQPRPTTTTTSVPYALDNHTHHFYIGRGKQSCVAQRIERASPHSALDRDLSSTKDIQGGRNCEFRSQHLCVIVSSSTLSSAPGAFDCYDVLAEQVRIRIDTLSRPGMVMSDHRIIWRLTTQHASPAMRSRLRETSFYCCIDT